METDAAVDKVSDPKSCPQRLGKACWLSLSFHRPGGGQPTNNKTGQITCYKNRTFSFASDNWGIDNWGIATTGELRQLGNCGVERGAIR